MKTTTVSYKEIISKFAGTCRNCEKTFEVGETILWTPGYALHVGCEVTMPKPQPEAKPLPRIPNGIYTVVFPDSDYQTVKFEIASKGVFEGRRICSYLSGTDNEKHYTGFAFVTDDNKLHCWKKFQYAKSKDKVMSAIRLLYKMVNENGDEALLQAGEAYALQSGKCCKCNRTLTVPASIHRGMGSVCSEKVW